MLLVTWAWFAVAGVALLGLAYGVWRVVPLLLAKPTISVDYVAEYNEVTKPADYDPDLNAAPHYKRFFANFSPLPEVLLAERGWTKWPGDLTVPEYEALERWASGNESALSDLKEAVRCPYWWTEVQSENGSLDGIFSSPHIGPGRMPTFALAALAQYHAHRGDAELALEILTDLHVVGFQVTQKATLIEQLAGLGTCDRSCKAVLSVLAKIDVDTAVLDRARRAFASQLARIQAPRFTRGEMLVALDGIQRSFTSDGRLIPRRLYDLTEDAWFLYPPLSRAGALWVALCHPSRRETVAAGQRLHETAQALTERSPWQMRSENTTYESELGKVVAGNYIFCIDCPSFARLITLGWRIRATGDALVTVLAILAYKGDQGHPPESLEVLVTEGLLDRVPMDPFSGGPLVYKVTGDDFTLYSVGEDFTDDGGEPGDWDDSGKDYVFWPVKEGD